MYDFTSDIHVDIQGIHKWHKAIVRPDWAAIKQSDILILAGDITNTAKKTMAVVQRAAEAYERVIFVDGNHEHYGNNNSRGMNINGTVRSDMDFLLDESQKHGRITYLNGETEFFQDGILFIGACGWYDFQYGAPFGTSAMQKQQWRQDSNDSRYCHFGEIGPEGFAREHADRLTIQVEAAQTRPEVEKIVIVTHTPASSKLLRYDHYNARWSILNGAYGNSLMENVPLVDYHSKIAVWHSGHVHRSQDLYINGIRYLSAPRGYENIDEQGRIWKGPLRVDPREVPKDPFEEMQDG